MTLHLWTHRIALASLLIAGAVMTLACGPDDGPSPPPNHVATVQAACNACTPSEAVHQCAAPVVGSTICHGIPVATVGDTMIVCGVGVSSQGRIGSLRWSSSNPDIAAVTPTALTVTHCVNEVANARLDAKSQGNATITLEEFSGGTAAAVSSATAVVTVKAPE